MKANELKATILIEKMLKSKTESNSTIDLNAYAIGLNDMYEYFNPTIEPTCDNCKFESECRFKSENINSNCKFFIVY